MIYSIALGNMVGSVDFDERMSSQDLELVKEMLIKAIRNRQDELRRSETLTLSDEITRLYPPISIRAQNCLLRAGIRTIGDVVKISEEDLMNVRNLGRKCHDEIKERFAPYGAFKEARNEQ